MDKPALIEQLAAVEHARWAGWMDYLFSQCDHHVDGSATIPPELVERWQRQVRTPYTDLSEREKESDRAEVLKTLHVLDNHGGRDVTLPDQERKT
jgi:hypothetical protein